jgi:hypothetical protein
MCTTESEEDILIVADKEDVITLGWVSAALLSACIVFKLSFTEA